jgi:hypothetical protein
MVTDQHKKISGYRDLTQVEIDLMNRIKAFGPQLQELVNDVNQHLYTQYDNGDRDECKRIDVASPDKWLKEGTLELQKGLMSVTRAVAQPTSF